MMVCYDGFFPEVARELSNRGAEVIAWPVWGCNPLLAAARACENHVYLISSTYTDAANWIISAIYGHDGRSGPGRASGAPSPSPRSTWRSRCTGRAWATSRPRSRITAPEAG